MYTLRPYETFPGVPVSDLARLLANVLAARPITRRYDSLAAFRAACSAVSAEWGDDQAPVDHAILGGALADRLGYAFAAGYAAALRSLFPSTPPNSCLCVTEAGGAAPRAIRTMLNPQGEGWTLTGEKAWATLAGDGDVLLVAASEGWDGARNRVRLVRVPGASPGVSVTPMPETPFAPEIPHYAVHFAQVPLPADAVFPGDGYARYVKPFRTVEDIHVSAAATAYLLRVAVDHGWPEDLRARAAALLVALHGLALADPNAPGVHIALGGCLALQTELIAACAPHWADVNASVAARWVRDVPLLRVAERARVQRLTVAFERLAG